MTHKEKVKLARRLSGKQSGHFDSPEWNAYKANVVHKYEVKMQNMIKVAIIN